MGVACQIQGMLPHNNSLKPTMLLRTAIGADLAFACWLSVTVHSARAARR